MQPIIITALLSGAVTLWSVAPAPLWAQDTSGLDQSVQAAQRQIKLINDLERWLREAEIARLKGDCATVGNASSFFYGMHMQTLAPGLASDFQRRMREIAARSCPPEAPAVPPVAGLPPPSPQTLATPDVPAPVGTAGTPATKDAPVEGHEPFLDEIADDPPAPVGSPAPEPRRTAPPVPPRKPDPVHVRPAPFPLPPPLPPSLETMIRETDSRERYLELRRMAEPGAVRIRVPPIESMMDQLDDKAAVEKVQKCQSALAKIPPPFAAAVLAAGSRATEKAELWYPGPDFSDTREAAEACAPVDRSAEKIAALKQEWREAMMSDLFEKQFGVRPEGDRATVTIKKELDDAEEEARRDENPYLLDPLGEERDAPLKLDPVSRVILGIHNEERAAVGAPALVWDTKLAASAASYGTELARLGQLVHAPRAGRENERENLLWGQRGYRSPEQMVGVWVNEKRNFVPGLFPDVSKTGNWFDVAHYTQMIWEGTTHVGCAIDSSSKMDYLVCRYSPPGNADGKKVP